MKQGSIKISSSRSISKYLNQMKYIFQLREFNNSISEYKHNTVNTPYHNTMYYVYTYIYMQSKTQQIFRWYHYVIYNTL